MNEIWIGGVKVPAVISWRRGAVTYAKFLLSHERTGIAGVGN